MTVISVVSVTIFVITAVLSVIIGTPAIRTVNAQCGGRRTWHRQPWLLSSQ